MKKTVTAATNPTPRDFPLDTLRTICVLGLFLAHALPPVAVAELRSFDVTFLVALSGILLVGSTGPTLASYPGYVAKRFLRLVMPSWIFLSILFGLLAVLDTAGLFTFPFTAEKVAGSYALMDGIGFVWIIRVYLMTALTAPLWLWVHHKTPGFAASAITLSAATLACGALWEIAPAYLSEGGLHALQLTFFTLIPFGLAMVVGMKLPALSTRQLLGLGALFTALFAAGVAGGFYYHQEWPLTQAYKYPPQAYYLCYGLAVGTFLYAARNLMARFFAGLPGVGRFISFVGGNSLWMYLWHVPFVFATHTDIMEKLGISLHWGARFAILMAGALAVTWVQSRIVGWLLPRVGQPWRARLATVFTG